MCIYETSVDSSTSLALSLPSCLVRITGDLTVSFPAAVARMFTANINVPPLGFRLLNASRIDHVLPNQTLLYRSADGA